MEKKCVVFDFDCTITYTHYYQFLFGYTDWVIKHANRKFDERIPDLREISNAIRDYRLPELEPLKNILEQINPDYEELLIKYIMGSRERLNEINRMMETFHDKGYDIFIASRGYSYLIGLLVNLFEIPYIKQIYGMPMDKSIPYISKEYRLEELFLNGYTKILYTDDDPAEGSAFIRIIKQKNYELDYQFMPLSRDGKGLSRPSILFLLNKTNE